MGWVRVLLIMVLSGCAAVTEPSVRSVEVHGQSIKYRVAQVGQNSFQLKIWSDDPANEPIALREQVLRVRVAAFAMRERCGETARPEIKKLNGWSDDRTSLVVTFSCVHSRPDEVPVMEAFLRNR